MNLMNDIQISYLTDKSANNIMYGKYLEILAKEYPKLAYSDH